MVNDCGKMTWPAFLAEQKQRDYLQNTEAEIARQRQAGQVIFPNDDDVYSAFESTPLQKVKVVILGQDPYHGSGQAHGLAFSVRHNIKVPPSLKNIYKELANEYADFVTPNHGNLQSWAQQGVFLLNTVLTVKEGQAHSHAKLGWEQFTDEVIQTINQQQDHVVFMLWGKHAHKKGRNIDRSKHLVLTSVHPSPLSAHRGFFGCQHFIQANQWLTKQNLSPICWQIPIKTHSNSE